MTEEEGGMFTKDDAARVRLDLDHALDAVRQSTGFKIAVGRITYTQTGCKAAIEVRTLTPEGLDATALATMPTEHRDKLGKSVRWSGQTFKVLGFNWNASRYPVEAERGDGKRFKLPEAALSCVVGAT